jgi:hypothetical protein
MPLLFWNVPVYQRWKAGTRMQTDRSVGYSRNATFVRRSCQAGTVPPGLPDGCPFAAL